MIFLIYWLAFGLTVWSYYMFSHDDSRLMKEYANGQHSKTSFILGLVLTIVFWPVAIYNNSSRSK